MKRIYQVFITLLLVSSTFSCKKDFLELQPLDKYSDEAVWKDPALVATYVNNIYLGVPFPFSVLMLSSVVDESMAVLDWETSNMNNGLVTPSYLATWGGGNGHMKTMSYSPMYKNIRACNLFLEKIDGVPFDDQAKKNQLKGEVLFLRAYFYHQLVSLYGGVPIITKAYTLTDDFQVPRDSFEKCINFIVADCDQAAGLLSAGGDKARATKGAALALKARILLYAASDLYNNNGAWAGSYASKELIGYVGGDRTARWTAAKNAAKSVMDLGVYTLYGSANPATATEATNNYANMFLNKGSSEDIFLQFYDVLHNGSWDAPNPGLHNGPNGWHNWGGSTPIGQMADAYEMADGSKFSWNNPAIAADPYKNRDPRFYASILYEGAKWRIRPADARTADPIGIVQVGSYKKADGSTVPGLDTRKSPIEDWNGGYTGYYLRKFIDPTIDHQYQKQQLPWRRFRYTEVLLNYAEACIQLGQEDEARTYINLIRKRGGMPPINDAGTALMERYRNERRVEMAYEEQRYYDVRRWMIGPDAYTDVQGVNVTGDIANDGTISNRKYSVIPSVIKRAWNPRSYLLPIALAEINRNKKLIQNPLY